MSTLVVLTFGFVSGIFLRSVTTSGLFVALFAVLLAIVCVIPPLLSSHSVQRVYIIGALFFLSVALGIGRASLTNTPTPEAFRPDLTHRVSYEGIVVRDPDLRDTNQRIMISVTRNNTSTTILAVAPRTTQVSVGDHVIVSGTLTLPEAFADDNGRIFRYDKYLQKDGVRFLLNFSSVRVLSHAPWYAVPALLARVKHAFLNGLHTALPEPYASLAGGIVIGGKSGLGSALQNAFTRSGLVQIIVLSGYNIMVVAEWVMAGIATFRLSRRWAALAGACAIVIFVGIAGASATALRAALMAFIALFARATGRSYAAGRALVFAILLMLLWNPLYLAFDPGFGLSVAATAGLIWLSPIIELYLATWARQIRRVCQVQRSETLSEFVLPAERPSFLLNAAATTFAAQITVLPLLLYDTGNLSIIAIPANLIIMPIVPVAMGFSALAGFAGILFGSLAPVITMVLGFPAYLTNVFLVFVAQVSASLPFAAFTLPLFPFWCVIVAYTGLIWFVWLKQIQQQPPLLRHTI